MNSIISGTIAHSNAVSVSASTIPIKHVSQTADIEGIKRINNSQKKKQYDENISITELSKPREMNKDDIERWFQRLKQCQKKVLDISVIYVRF